MKNEHSYLSMIAHMSRLTFSKAPIVPFSTACKSAGWSSTKIACMQPWKERWEGGNSVWRKYPKTSKRNKMKLYCGFFFLQLQITEMNKLNKEQNLSRSRNKRMHSSLFSKNRVTEVKECGRTTINKKKMDAFDPRFKTHHEKTTFCRSRHQT